MKIYIKNVVTFSGRVTDNKSLFYQWKTNNYKMGIGLMEFKDIPSISFWNNLFVWYYRDYDYLFIRVLWFTFNRLVRSDYDKAKHVEVKK